MVKKMKKVLKNQTSEFIEVLNMLNKNLFAEDITIKKKSSFLAFFVKKGFTITLRNSIKVDPNRKLSIGTLFHECQHYMDQCKYDEKDGLYHKSFWGALKFYIKYTFPQNLVLFSLLALFAIPFSNYFLVSLIFLLGLIPSPKLTRARANYELRGYFWSWLIDERTQYKDTFSGASYYYMDYHRADSFYNQVFKGYQVMIEHGQYKNMYRLYRLYKELKV